MKVAVWYNNNDIRIEERPKPKCASDELLIKVHSCGICGSDLVEWYRLPRAPLIPGHEMSGEIVQVGNNVKGFFAGDRVAVAPKVGCGECEVCLGGHESICPNVKERVDGAFAEFVKVPAGLVPKAVFKIPDSVEYDVATFIEPLACVIRAQRFAELKESDRVLVLGSGMSGLLHIKLALYTGAKVTAVDINEDRLDFAKKLGANVVNAKDELNSKFDVVIICAAALPVFESAWKSIDLGGRIVLFTVPAPDKRVVVPVNDFWTKEVKIINSYYCGPNDLKKSFELISNGDIKVDDLISKSYKLDDIQKAFSEVGKSVIKAIIKPNE